MDKELENKLTEVNNSYINKDDFIKIISELKFSKVKECSLELITGIILDTKENDVKVLGFHIDIELE